VGRAVDFWKTLLVLLRRWYVAVPALVVSAGLAAMAYQSIPPKYEATGSVALLTPTQGAGGSAAKNGPSNPLLSFDGSLETTAQLLTQVLLSPATAEELAGQGATADYEVGDANIGGPFVNVVATGRSAAEAQRTVTLVLNRAREELLERENKLNAPRSSYIVVQDVVRPTEAKALVGGKTKGAGAALALGLAASLGSAFMIESIVENRRDRHGVPRAARRQGPRRQGAAAEFADPLAAPQSRQSLAR
jgi:uncharacterized protein involved in exopolysaccharide biosynthesis